MIDVAFRCPKISELTDRVHMPSQLLKNFHKLLVTDSKVLQNSARFVLVFFNVTEDSLSKVFDHIFSLSLFFFETRLNFSIITLRLDFEERAVRLIFELIFQMNLMLRVHTLLVLNDFYVIFSSEGIMLVRWLWTVVLTLIDIPILTHFSAVPWFVVAARAAIAALLSFAEDLAEHILSF